MLEQPHFDDERTVLTARPVVPFEQIDTTVKHRRRWFLGGAFAVAILLGAALAVISAYFKFRNIPDPEIQSLSVSQPVAEIVRHSPKSRGPETGLKRTERIVPLLELFPLLNRD